LHQHDSVHVIDAPAAKKEVQTASKEETPTELPVPGLKRRKRAQACLPETGSTLQSEVSD
jgi:hypothetical protein